MPFTFSFLLATLAATYCNATDPATIIARKQVPILCYHQIRDWTAKDSKTAKDYICPIATFKAHMKMLADSGYHTILPDQLYAYLTTGAALPSKPIMLTFDDTDLDQFTIANPELKKYHYKAVYFVMTVSLGRPHYMTADMVKKLSDEGNIVGSHTWDHHMVSKYTHNGVFKIKGKNGKITTRPVDDWVTQIDKPTKKLEEITGKKMDYFAYPFGIWNKAALPELKKRGFKAAFQLADKRDPVDPLMTIRRIIASGFWTAKNLSNSIKASFK
ncbi:polysaccharide deacetylase family protein [Mucilaginibacter gracilis]|uniref:polysaccharide deacetylase family protein n=1 Tax=Mucilaginibacter gracilis TaxID=423350 RepID=UPI003744820C